MNINNKLAWAFTCLFSFVLLSLWVSCSKSSSGNNNTTDEKVTLITQTAWKYDTSGIDVNKDGIISAGDFGDATVETCTKDNSYQFKKDSSGTMDEGSLKCSSSDPQTLPFHWNFTNNQTALVATFNPLLSGGVNIISLTDTKFVVYKDTSYLGANVRYLISLKH
ncbi:hypothetical protein ACX0G9_07480 [Flavitalea flava]